MLNSWISIKISTALNESASSFDSSPSLDSNLPLSAYKAGRVLNNRFSSRPIVDLYGLYPKLGFGGKRKCPKAQKAKKNSLLQIVILRGETNCLF